MDQILQSLFSRLVRKGLTPENILGLIRDVGNTLTENSNVSARMVSERMAYLGWEKELIDEYLFQLILPLIHRKNEIPLPTKQ